MGKPLGVDLDGALASWSALLPHLLTIAQREGLFRTGVWRCRCVDASCKRAPSKAQLPGGVWSRCPYAVLRAPHFATLAALRRSARVAPLAGWPDAYAAWIGWGLTYWHERDAEATR